MISTPIIEIFSSKQGEGPYVGEPMTFVRLQDCEFNCQWCDTPLSFVENKTCRIEKSPFSKQFERTPNPFSIQTLNGYLSRFSDPTLSVTGGEPLQKVPFLKEWLPTVRSKFKILLETAGIHFRELAQILDLVDIVSMDLKLPSSTGMKAYWNEHEHFLKLAKEKDTYVKVVVTSETKTDDLRQAISLVQDFANIPFILQPVTPLKGSRRPSEEQLLEWKDLALKSLGEVKITPQKHREWGIL